MIRTIGIGLGIFLIGAASGHYIADFDRDFGVAMARKMTGVHLEDFSTRWRTAYEAGDFVSMRDLYEPDARLMTRGQPAKIGVDAILTYFETSRQSGAKVEITFDYEQVVIDGNYAFMISKWWLESPQAVGEPLRDAGRSLVIFKRGKHGVWRLWRDIDNHTPDVTFDNKPDAG